MARHATALSQWIEEVSRRLPPLSRTQATVLALYSFGMVVAGSCGLSSVVCALSLLLGQKENTLRQRLREWYLEAESKKGEKRRELEVSACFAPLLRWVLSQWGEGEKRLALALDASTLGQRFTVLSINVVYRGCALPVAWRVLAATAKGAWRPIWLELLQQLAGVVGDEWLVVVLTDRGLYARWLFQAIVALQWHPFMRINTGGYFRPRGQRRFRPLAELAPEVGAAWAGEGDCFVSPRARLSATLLAHWAEEQAEPWLVLTDLPVEMANVAWYGMRAWIEQSYKDCKRGGWHWEQTKMTDPARATRLWLALAVATLWVVSVGGEADASLQPSSLEYLPPVSEARSRGGEKRTPRRLSCFRRGGLVILAALIRGEGLPFGLFVPEAWPDCLSGSRKRSERSGSWALAPP